MAARLILFSLLLLSSVQVIHSSSIVNVTVVGTVFCDACSENTFSKHSYFIQGAKAKNPIPTLSFNVTNLSFADFRCQGADNLQVRRRDDIWWRNLHQHGANHRQIRRLQTWYSPGRRLRVQRRQINGVILQSKPGAEPVASLQRAQLELIQRAFGFQGWRVQLMHLRLERSQL